MVRGVTRGPKRFPDIRFACRMSICVSVETFPPPEWSCDRLERVVRHCHPFISENTTVDLMPLANSRTRKTIPNESFISPKIGKRFIFTFLLIFFFFFERSLMVLTIRRLFRGFCENGF